MSFENGSEEDEEVGPGIGLGDLLSQVQDMQERLASAQAEAAEKVVQGQAAGGAVTVLVSGALDFRGNKIDPSLFAESDVTLVEDLVLAALRDAMERVGELNRAAMAHSGLEDLAELDDVDLRDLGSLPGIGGVGTEPDEDDWDDTVR